MRFYLAGNKFKDRFGCISIESKIFILPTYDYISQGVKNKQLLLRKDSLYGFINNRERIQIKPQFQNAYLFCEGIAAVSYGKKNGFIKIVGDTFFPFIYDVTFIGFINGLIGVTLNDGCGFIDNQG